MPETPVEQVPAQTPAPTPAPAITTQSSKIPFYAACIVVLVLSFSLYSYVTKFRETKTTLDQTVSQKTVVTQDLKELKEEFYNYQKDVESKTSWIKRPYIYKGKLVTDGKGKAVYTIAYFKDAHAISSGGKSIVDELSKTVTITQAVTVVTHEKIDKTEGVKIQGAAYVNVPADIFTGNFSRAGVNVDHNFFLGSVLGVGAGTTDTKNIFKSAYVDLHLGFGIP
jgi:hypothetical protein